LLTRIWTRNLACFGDAEYHIDLAPETVIIGPNNVGKSAMIAAFNFLRSNPLGFGRVQFVPQWDTTTYNWGDFHSIVHRHEDDRTIGIGATLKDTNWDFEIAAKLTKDVGESTLQTPSERSGRELAEASLRRELAGIWYLGASRSGIPRQLQVGRSGYDTAWHQPIESDGSNAITYLLERFTSRDHRWAIAEDWLRHITPEASILKSPLRGNLASVETTDRDFAIDVNIAYQGTGIQKVLSTIAALVFSPEGSTIIIEEPEINLHPRSQEVLVDLFNLAVNDWKKQVIFTTHSWDMLQPFASDIATGSPRGAVHVRARPENFKLIVFNRVGDDIKIEELPIKGKEYMYLRDYLKKLWG